MTLVVLMRTWYCIGIALSTSGIVGGEKKNGNRLTEGGIIVMSVLLRGHSIMSCFLWLQ